MYTHTVHAVIYSVRAVVVLLILHELMAYGVRVDSV